MTNTHRVTIPITLNHDPVHVIGVVMIDQQYKDHLANGWELAEGYVKGESRNTLKSLGLIEKAGYVTVKNVSVPGEVPLTVNGKQVGVITKGTTDAAGTITLSGRIDDEDLLRISRQDVMTAFRVTEDDLTDLRIVESGARTHQVPEKGEGK